MNANTPAPAPAPAPTLAMPVNTGLLAMRAANACKRLGLRPRDADAAPLATPAKPRQTPEAPRRVSAEPPAPDAPEAEHAFRVAVLVGDADAQTHAFVQVCAAGPRRAMRAARAHAFARGLTTHGTPAVVRDDAPQALWDALTPLLG